MSIDFGNWAFRNSKLIYFLISVLIVGGALSAREVRIESLRSDGEAVISGGLEPGEIIVISGVHKIAEGEKVKILPKASATNAGGLL